MKLEALSLGAMLLLGLAGGCDRVVPLEIGAVARSATAGPDEPDDPAIWIDERDPSRSLILGTHKDRGGGIAVHDLSGALLQFVDDRGGTNNIDLRPGFAMGGNSVALVATTLLHHGVSDIAFYVVDPEARRLVALPSASFAFAAERVYGLCMYRSQRTGRHHLFVTAKDDEGLIEQWELSSDGRGGVGGLLRRRWWVGGTVEGCVADDEHAALFLAEEERGIWRYGAEPGDGLDRVLVDGIAGGHLHPNIEGLAVVTDAAGDGYLLASSEGNDTLVVYRRSAPFDYVATLRVTGPDGATAARGSEGIEATTRSLGEAYPHGVLIVHDDKGEPEPHFRIVPWEHVADALAQSVRR